MSCPTHTDRIDAYLDGMLPPREQREVSQHTAECRDCAETLRQTNLYRAAVRELPEQSPPSDLRGRIFAATTRAPRPVRVSIWGRLAPRPAWALVGAAAVLVAVFALVDIGGQKPGRATLAKAPQPRSRDKATLGVLQQPEKSRVDAVVVQPPALMIGAQVGIIRSTSRESGEGRAIPESSQDRMAAKPRSATIKPLEHSPVEAAIKIASEELEVTRGLASWKFNEGSSRRAREVASSAATSGAKTEVAGGAGSAAELGGGAMRQARWSGDAIRESRDQINDDLARVMGAIETQSWMNARKDKPVMRLVKFKT